MPNPLSRRDFLKASSTFLLGGMVWLNDPNLPAFAGARCSGQTWPRLTVDQLPGYHKEILGQVLESDVNFNGILRVVNKPVPVYQTIINLKNLKLAENFSAFRCKETLGIIYHSFGADDKFLKLYMPHGSAEEYVKNGFGSLTSAMFLVGDDKFDIVQCELPTPEGRMVPSAHTIPVSRDPVYVKKQRFVQYMNQVCYQFKLPQDISVLQNLHTRGQNSDPNRSTIGVEITGMFFDSTDGFPSTKKIASVVTLSMALSRYYKISPAFDYFGHREVDFEKADPGKRFVYLIKLLVGLECLIKNDDYLNAIVFGPFAANVKTKKECVLAFFDFITTYFRISSDTTEAENYLTKIDYDKIIDEIKKSA
jgi:hypothetical protein